VTPGLTASFQSLKRLLDKIGIQVEMEATGDYKSAADAYTRDKMTPANREQLTALLDAREAALLEALARGRHKDVAAAKAQLAAALTPARDARTAEWVDGLAHRDELPKILGERFGATGGEAALVSMASRVERRVAWRSPPRIAVVVATGMMMRGDSRQDLFMGDVLGAETLVDALRQARLDPAVRAVVLRINSGGGDVQAAEAIRREAELLTKAKKPLIVSMGDVAGSGGYWIALPAQTIYAHAGTVTGSIGVIYGKVSAVGLLQTLGIRTEALVRGEHADALDPHRALTAGERQILRRLIEDIYDQFLDRVAEARKFPKFRVRQLAGGRIYAGTRAKELGLVDAIGGLGRALEAARAAAKAPDAEVVFLPGQPPWLAALLAGRPPGISLDDTRALLLGPARSWVWMAAPGEAP
jgi:protease-4